MALWVLAGIAFTSAVHVEVVRPTSLQRHHSYTGKRLNHTSGIALRCSHLHDFLCVVRPGLVYTENEIEREESEAEWIHVDQHKPGSDQQILQEGARGGSQHSASAEDTHSWKHTTFVIGHIEVKRGAKWSDKRYFVLDLDRCILSYNEYTDKVNGVPWVIETSTIDGEEASVKLKPNKKTDHVFDLKDAQYVEEQNDIKFQFGNKTEFFVKDRPTKSQGIHHYPQIGNSSQLYPSLHHLKEVFKCDMFLIKHRRSSEQYTIDELKHLKEKKNSNKNGGSRHLDKYPKFKKLMCLMDIEENPENKGFAEEIVYGEFVAKYQGKKIPRYNMIMAEAHGLDKISGEFTFDNLKECDHARSRSTFNGAARKFLTSSKYFKDGDHISDEDTWFLPWLSVLVKGMYRVAWLSKYDPEEDVTSQYRNTLPKMLYRGFKQTKSFLDDLKNKIGKEGEFSFDYIAGFSGQPHSAASFLLDKAYITNPNPDWNQRIFYFLAPTTLARKLESSYFAEENESIMLPHVPLTVEHIGKLSDKASKLKALNTSHFDPQAVQHALAQIKEYLEPYPELGNSAKTKFSSIHIVFLRVADINFLDVNYIPLMPPNDGEPVDAIDWFNENLGKPEEHYCGSHDIVKVGKAPKYKEKWEEMNAK
mmetsp:Transcript_7149/g.13223  ORF Transcript_7149/g.13223 Transcript_7149/m.13223 type:complete len:646 (+) Transcript_7149:49-1986(+)